MCPGWIAGQDIFAVMGPNAEAPKSWEEVKPQNELNCYWYTDCHNRSLYVGLLRTVLNWPWGKDTCLINEWIKEWPEWLAGWQSGAGNPRKQCQWTERASCSCNALVACPHWLVKVQSAHLTGQNTVAYMRTVWSSSWIHEHFQKHQMNLADALDRPHVCCCKLPFQLD